MEKRVTCFLVGGLEEVMSHLPFTNNRASNHKTNPKRESNIARLHF